LSKTKKENLSVDPQISEDIQQIQKDEKFNPKNEDYKKDFENSQLSQKTQNMTSQFDEKEKDFTQKTHKYSYLSPANPFEVTDYNKGIDKHIFDFQIKNNNKQEYFLHSTQHLLENKENDRLGEMSSYQSILLSSRRQTKNVEESFRSYGRDYYIDRDDSFRQFSGSSYQRHPFQKINKDMFTSKRLYEDELPISSERSKVTDFLNKYHKVQNEIEFGGSGLIEKMSSSRNKENYNLNLVSSQISGGIDKKKTKVSEVLADMKESQEKLKRSYYSYKLDRFKYYMNKVLRTIEIRNKQDAFNMILHKSNEQDILLLEVSFPFYQSLM